MVILNVSCPRRVVSVSISALNRSDAIAHRMQNVRVFPTHYQHPLDFVEYYDTLCGNHFLGVPTRYTWQRPRPCSRCSGVSEKRLMSTMDLDIYREDFNETLRRKNALHEYFCKKTGRRLRVPDLNEYQEILL